MFDSVVRSVARRIAPLAIGATALGTALMGSPTAASVAAVPISHPLIDDWAYLGNSGVPPSQAACNAVGRRCFNPTAMIWAVARTDNPDDPDRGLRQAIRCFETTY